MDTIQQSEAVRIILDRRINQRERLTELTEENDWLEQRDPNDYKTRKQS